MLNETDKELRRIRIALVFIAIIILISGGARTVTIDQDSNGGDFNPEYRANMVPLGDGYFGVLTSDTDNIEQTMRVYFFDKETKKFTFIRENDLEDIDGQSEE